MKTAVSLIIIMLINLCSSAQQGKKEVISFFPGLENRKGIYYKADASEPYTGSTKSIYENGTPYVTASFKDGKLHGTYRAYYANGQIMGESNYKMGIKHGASVSWHEKGKKASEINFINGKKEGLFKMYYATGQQSAEAYFKHGKLDGGVTQWRPDGKLHAIKSYEADSLVWEEYYNQEVQESVQGGSNI